MNDYPPEMKQQASLWAIRLAEAPLSKEQQQALGEWLAEDVRHTAALQQAQALWATLGALNETQAALVMPPRQRTATYWRLAAAITLTLGLSSLWLPDWVLSWRADYLAGHEVRRIVLPDGSQADMDAGSAIAVDYRDGERRIVLLRGNVWFTVAPTDAAASRPFRVSADQGTTQALGTQFVVAHAADHTTVSVVQHSVRVSVGKQQRVVQASQQVRYTATGIVPLPSEDEALDTEWRQGWLTFHQQPLAQVVERMNRYRTNRIIVTGAALQHRQLSGIFAIARLDDALDTLTQQLGAHQLALPGFTVIY